MDSDSPIHRGSMSELLPEEIDATYMARQIIEKINYQFAENDFNGIPIIYSQYPEEIQKELDNKRYFFVYDLNIGVYRAEKTLDHILGRYSNDLLLWTEDDRGRYNLHDFYHNKRNYNLLIAELKKITAGNTEEIDIIMPQKLWRSLRYAPYYKGPGYFVKSGYTTDIHP